MNADEILAGFAHVRDVRGRVLVYAEQVSNDFGVWTTFRPKTVSGARPLGGACISGGAALALSAARYALGRFVYPGDEHAKRLLREHVAQAEAFRRDTFLRELIAEACGGDEDFLDVVDAPPPPPEPERTTDGRDHDDGAQSARTTDSAHSDH